MTTAKYFTPSGRSIQKTGIEPDIVVEERELKKTDNKKVSREEDLKGALKNPSNKNKEEENKEKSDEIADFQLSRALDLVRGISLYNTKTIN